MASDRSKSGKIDMSIPREGVEVMEERRGRVEGRIDDEGNYHDTYKGDPVIGKRDGKTGDFQYEWDIKV
jgi:hypothetical protein